MKTATRSVVFAILSLTISAHYAFARQVESSAPAMTRPPSGVHFLSIDEQNLPPELKSKLHEQAKLMKQHKVIPVSDNQVFDFALADKEHTSKKKKGIGVLAEPPLTFTPASIEQTSLKSGQYLGSTTHSGLYRGAWTGYSRLYSHPRLGRVMFEEMDVATGDSGVTISKEMINADVNGAPAVMVSLQGSEKKGITRLTWVSKGMDYELSAPRVDDKSRDELLEIARQISP
jgi:hypothetical protein